MASVLYKCNIRVLLDSGGELIVISVIIRHMCLSILHCVTAMALGSPLHGLRS